MQPIRPIDANRVMESLQDFVNWCRDGRRQGAEFCLDCVIPNTPTLEVILSVRCKDCIQWDKYDLMPRDADGKERHHCPHLGINTDEHFSCSDGEREEE